MCYIDLYSTEVLIGGIISPVATLKNMDQIGGYQITIISLRPSNAKCVSKLTVIGLNNGLSPCQVIILTNDGILLIGTLGTNFNEILIEIHIFSFKKNAFGNVVCKMAASTQQGANCVYNSWVVFSYLPHQHSAPGTLQVADAQGETIHCSTLAPGGQWSEAGQVASAAENSAPMMTSSNGNIFRVTGHLCGEFTGHR